MKDSKIFCLYKHTSPSNKCYIGITSQDPKHRWGDNGKNYLIIKDDGSFKHPYFANAILKYGWDNFNHEILYENLDEEEAQRLEKEYIAIYKQGGKSYNITDGGEGVSGYKFTPEQIKKLSQSHTGIKQSSETIAKRVAKNIGKTRTDEQKMKTSKPVKQYTKDLKFVAEYFGIREASVKTGINSAHISQCCNKKRKSAGNYIWVFNESDLPKIFSKDNASRKEVLQYDLSGNLIKRWKSIKEVVITCNISKYKLNQYSKTNTPDKNNNIWKIIEK